MLTTSKSERIQVSYCYLTDCHNEVVNKQLGIIPSHSLSLPLSLSLSLLLDAIGGGGGGGGAPPP